MSASAGASVPSVPAPHEGAETTRSKGRWASERRLFAAVLLLAAVLAAPLPHANENRTLDLVHALEHGRFAIDQEHENTGDKAYVPSPARRVFAELGSVPDMSVLRRGHFYCGGAPGLAFALLPAALVGRPFVPERLNELWLVLFGAALPLAAGAIGVRRAVLRATSCDEDTASGVALLHALGTIALPFGTRLYAHSLEACLLAWALALVLRRPEVEGKPRGAWAGLLAALAVTCDYNVAPLAALVGVLALVRGGLRGAVEFTLGTLPAAFALGTYHQVCFGSPFKTPYDWHWDGSIVQTLNQGRYGFTYPRPWILGELLFGRRRGLLFTEPAALVGIVGLVRLARRSPAHAIGLAAAAVSLLANAARAADWDAGSCFGPRYTTAALPFIALGLPAGLALLGRWARPVAIASVILALVGATTSWGFSIETNLDCIWFLGPRLTGISELFAGATPVQLDGHTVLAGAIALGLALPATLALASRSRPEPAALAALGLAPLAACLPIAYALFLGGPDPVLTQSRRIVRRESGRAIRAARDAAEMRRLVWHVAIKADEIRAPDLYLEALERMVELDPGDAVMRAKRDRLRARLLEEQGR